MVRHAACLLALLYVSTAVCGSTALSAQAPPELPSGSDLNDWVDYYSRGMRLLGRSPDRAEAYFAYASRLEPGAAEPLVARYVAWWRHRPELWTLWINDDKLVRDDAEIHAAQQWVDRALLINPFVRLTLLRYTIPDNVRGRMIGGNTPLEKGLDDFFEERFESSARQFATAIERGRQTFASRYWRGLALAQLGRWGEVQREFHALVDSLTEYRSARTLHGDLRVPELFHTLGLAYFNGGDTAAANRAFERALEEDLSFYLAHMSYGTILWRQGRRGQALQELALAVELAPDDPLPRQTYAATLLRAGRADSALAQFHEAMRLEPLSAGPYFNLAVTYERLGQRAQALSGYREYLARAPKRQSEQVTYATQRLASLSR